MTCPTRNVATPASFATRRIRAAASRTCATEPGAEPISAAVERLHRVDHADAGPLALERRADDVELGLGEDLDRLAAAEPRGAQLHLRDRLLARDEQRPPLARDRPERREEQRRLADAGLAADEHERRRHEAAAEDPVELADPGRDPVGLLGLDLDERGAAAARPTAAAPRAGAASSTIVPNAPQPGQRPSQRPETVPHSLHDVLEEQPPWPRAPTVRPGSDGAAPAVPRGLTAAPPRADRVDRGMRYRPLGDSGIEVSEIALGSWLTFGAGVGDEAARACADAALEV